MVGEGDFVAVQNIQFYLKPSEQRKLCLGRIGLSEARLSIVVELAKNTLRRTHVKDASRILKGTCSFFFLN